MNTNFLGIEYAKDRIKCAHLVFDGKKYQISSLELFEGAEVSPIDKLVDWKNRVLGESRVKAVVSISESSIFLKELKVPNAGKAALDEAVYWELANVSPLPPSQSIYEWEAISEEKDLLSIVAMAVKSSLIEPVIDKLEAAGIEVAAIEPSSTSLSRVAGDSYSKNTMLLMVGERETDIVVLKEGKPVFSTTSDVQLGRDSEKWKLSKTVIEKIAKSTEDLINFWEEKEDDKIRQVLITGDLVDKYYGLAVRINEFAKIPVNIAKEKSIKGLYFSNLQKATIHRFLVSVGAVARFGGDIYSGINLIPQEKRQIYKREVEEEIKNQRFKTFNYFMVFTLSAILIMGVFFTTLNYSYAAGIENYNNLIGNHPAQKIKGEVKEVNSYFEKINKLMSQKRDQGEKIRKISELTPGDVKLTKLEYSNDIEEKCILQGTASREAVLSYQKELESELGVKSVTMLYSGLNNDSENDFEIHLIW